MSETVDLEAVKQAQQKTWSEGDFAMVAGLVMMVAEELVEELDIVPGERVLDVACGSGNGALAAARRSWGNAVGVDFVPALLERGRERAAAERLDVEFVEGDAADLPFGDGEFDVVISIFGAMFAPEQREGRRRAAAGLQARRPDRDGQLGPGRRASAACSRRSPSTRRRRPGWFRRCCGAPRSGCASCSATASRSCGSERRTSRQAFRSIDHYLDFFRTYFGPIKMAFDRVGPEGEAALEADLRELAGESEHRRRPRFVLEPEYLQVIATRA